jgi:glycosyltransferase involved in cell wall biosynthesis
MNEPPLIICAATQYWDEAWFRKQRFMLHLSRRWPVLYVEPSFSLVRRVPAHCPPGQANRWFAGRLRERGSQLWSWAPPRGLPFWTHTRISHSHYGRMGQTLRRVAAGLGHRRTWLWLYNPLYVQSRAALAPERMIFDLVDDLGAYAGHAPSRRTMTACVETALGESDLVFTTSPMLARNLAEKTRNGEMHIVPNGVSAAWTEREPGPIPEELRNLPRPWIGFMGAIFTYLDFDLLVATARAFPGGSLILVGPVQDETGAARLRREPNVVLLGRRPQERIPDYLAAFDVCLSPFRAGDVRRAVNPLKVYEYLAAGRPVVSTPLESLAGEPVAEWIRFAEGTAAFTAAIREELAAEGAAGRARERREAVRAYTWEALAVRVERILERAAATWEGER